MRRIGLIGGTTYHSTLEYYRIINEVSSERTAGRDCAALTLDSLNFGEITRNNSLNDQEANCQLVVDAALRLKEAKVEALVLCANTLHMFAPEVQAASGLPILHIAETTSDAIVEQGLRTVALLGTKFTMNLDIYHSLLASRGIQCITPEEVDAEAIHASIYTELARGDFSKPMKDLYLGAIDRLIERGAQGVILGCTEIPLLLKPDEIPIPSFDTTRLHAQAAVDFMLGA
jgi:aspartate racemase